MSRSVYRKLSFVHVAGACAIAYTVSVVAVIALFMQNGLLEAARAIDVLPLVVAHQRTALAAGWLLMLAPLLFVLAAAGFSELFRDAGASTRAALVVIVIGLAFAWIRNAVWLALMYEAGPAYAAGSVTVQASIVAMTDTVLRFGTVIGDMTGAPLVGLGMVLFSAAILRTRRAPRWVGWLGIVVGGMAGAQPLMAVAPELEVLVLASFPGLAVWMVAMGIVLWRMPAPDSHSAHEPPAGARKQPAYAQVESPMVG